MGIQRMVEGMRKLRMVEGKGNWTKVEGKGSSTIVEGKRMVARKSKLMAPAQEMQHMVELMEQSSLVAFVTAQRSKLHGFSYISMHKLKDCMSNTITDLK